MNVNRKVNSLHYASTPFIHETGSVATRQPIQYLPPQSSSRQLPICLTADSHDAFKHTAAPAPQLINQHSSHTPFFTPPPSYTQHAHSLQFVQQPASRLCESIPLPSSSLHLTTTPFSPASTSLRPASLEKPRPVSSAYIRAQGKKITAIFL
jgi:hypothetical protein